MAGRGNTEQTAEGPEGKRPCDAPGHSCRGSVRELACDTPLFEADVFPKAPNLGNLSVVEWILSGQCAVSF